MTAVLVLPFFALAPGGVGYSLWTQLKRHLQIESLGSSILLAGSKLGLHHEGWIKGKPGSIDLGGGAANVVGVLSAVVAVALVLVVARDFWRGPDDDARLVTAFAAAVTAFVVFGKVLSPQYLTWLVPLVPLVAGPQGPHGGARVLRAPHRHTARVPRRRPRPPEPELDRVAAPCPQRRPGRDVFALLLGQLRDSGRPT